MAKKNNKTEHIENIHEPLLQVSKEINDILTNSVEDKYLVGIVLSHSFIENLLKWLVFIKILWNKTEDQGEIEVDEYNTIKRICSGMTFYNAVNSALSINLIDKELHKLINEVRKDRNDIIHNFWLYKHRNSPTEIRTELEKVVNAAGSLAEIYNSLTDEIGVDEVYELMLND